MNDRRATSILLLALATVTACGVREPRAIVEGQDSCDYCRMSISDARFGAQVITSTGKIHTFDSVECVAGFVAALDADTKLTGVYVTNFANAGEFVRAEQAVYLMDGRIESPMGRRLVAFAQGTDTTRLIREHGGTVLDWEAVQLRLDTLSHEHASLGGLHAH
jgi:copper chaperone NosL